MYLKLLDSLFETVDKITAYICNTPNPDCSLIETTFQLCELQLQQIYQEHYKDIFADEALWCYYEALVENINFLHYRIDQITT